MILVFAIGLVLFKSAKKSKTTPTPAANGENFEKDGFHFRKHVVVDTQSGLMWVRNGNITENEMTWDSAMAWVKTLNYGGYHDWRLPTKEELDFMAKRGGDQPSVYFNELGFVNTQPYFYWSSSSYAKHTDNAWNVYMFNGNLFYDSKYSFLYVWPVRAGQ